MKKIRFIIFVVITSIVGACGSSETTNEVDQNSVFESFLDLFPDLKLPFSTNDLPCGKAAIDMEAFGEFLLPNGEYDSEVLYPVGKFAIEETHIGVVFCYSSSIAGDVKVLFIYDLNGTYVSSLVIETEHRQFSQYGKIHASFEIELSEYTGDGSIEYAHYKIKNGNIKAREEKTLEKDVANNGDDGIYRVIIAYAPSKEGLTDQWIKELSSIEAELKQYGVIVTSTYTTYVSYTSAKLDFEIDLQAYMDARDVDNYWYFFLQFIDESPYEKQVPYDNPKVIVSQAKKYFGL